MSDLLYLGIAFFFAITTWGLFPPHSRTTGVFGGRTTTNSASHTALFQRDPGPDQTVLVTKL
jgi:hypothetical protein